MTAGITQEIYVMMEILIPMDVPKLGIPVTCEYTHDGGHHKPAAMFVFTHDDGAIGVRKLCGDCLTFEVSRVGIAAAETFMDAVGKGTIKIPKQICVEH